MDKSVSMSIRHRTNRICILAPEEAFHFASTGELPPHASHGHCGSEALRQKLSSIKEDDPQHRTFAEVLAENLVSLACAQERNSVAAAVEIANRVEGRVQRIELADFTQQQLTTKSDAELEHFLEFGSWPEDVNVSHQPGGKIKAN